MRCTVRPLHDAIFRLAANFYADIFNVSLLTYDVNIQVTPKSPTLANTIEEGGKKIQAWHTFPNTRLIHENPGTKESDCHF